MNFVDQTKFHDDETGERGNCLRAAISSVLGIGIEDMPHFEDQGYMGDAFVNWCYTRGLEPVFTDGPYSPDAPKGYSLAIGLPAGMADGENPNNIKHCVVALDGRTVFDPNPNRRCGLIAVDYYLTFEPVEKAA